MGILGQTDSVPPYQIHLSSQCPSDQLVPCFALRKRGDKTLITLVGQLEIIGIHTYIEACAHELGHRQNIQAGIELNHAEGVRVPGDADGDRVLDSWEQNHYLDNANPDTGGWYTKHGDPSIGDAETLCQIVGLGVLIKNYGLFSQDWASPGTQYLPFPTPDNQTIVWTYTQTDAMGNIIPGTTVYNQPLPAEILTVLP